MFKKKGGKEKERKKRKEKEKREKKDSKMTPGSSCIRMDMMQTGNV